MAPIFLPAIREAKSDKKIPKFPELGPHQVLHFQVTITDCCTVSAEMTQPAQQIPAAGFALGRAGIAPAATPDRTCGTHRAWARQLLCYDAFTQGLAFHLGFLFFKL